MAAHECSSRALHVNLTAGVKRRLNQAGVDLQAGTFGDSGIRGLVEDWIVPVVVDRIIETIVGSLDALNHADGGGAQGFERLRRAAGSDGR